MPHKRNPALAALTLLASISTLAVAGASQAQVPPPGPAGAARPAGPRQGPPGDFRAQIQTRLAERNKDLATVLRLRPDQMGALDAFVASQTPKRPDRAPGAGLQGAPGQRPDRGAPLTTPQRLDRQAQRGQMMAQMMQQRAQGLRTSYAALSPDQQQVFDALTRLRDAGGMRMKMGRGGRGGPGGPGGPAGPRGPGGPGGFPAAPPR